MALSAWRRLAGDRPRDVQADTETKRFGAGRDREGQIPVAVARK